MKRAKSQLCSEGSAAITTSTNIIANYTLASIVIGRKCQVIALSDNEKVGNVPFGGSMVVGLVSRWGHVGGLEKW